MEELIPHDPNGSAPNTDDHGTNKPFVWEDEITNEPVQAADDDHPLSDLDLVRRICDGFETMREVFRGNVLKRERADALMGSARDALWSLEYRIKSRDLIARYERGELKHPTLEGFRVDLRSLNDKRLWQTRSGHTKELEQYGGGYEGETISEEEENRIAEYLELIRLELVVIDEEEDRRKRIKPSSS
ncbi:MAG: hypothetical protein WCI73_08615 [Phycisphaerae bacterium]